MLANFIPDDHVQADYKQWQEQVQQAVSEFDDQQLDRVYGQIFSSYTLPVVFEAIIMPLWRQLLQRRDAFGQTSEWLFLDGFLRARVLQRIVMLRGLNRAGWSSVRLRGNAESLSCWSRRCFSVATILACGC